MPAPSPYTPPQPSEPPKHPTPRISRARRLSSCSSRKSTSSSHRSPGSTERTLQNPSVRRQILPSTSTAPSRSPSPVPAEEESEEEEDEDLKDPEHFINAFSAVNGPLTKLNSKFFESLLQKLERYLFKVNLSPNHRLYMPANSKTLGGGAGNVNFVEAALVVQGSTRIYGKKVDLLFDAAINLFRILSTPFEEMDEEEDGEEGEEKSPVPKNRKGTKRPRLTLENRDLAEEILAVDNFKEGKKIDQKKPSRRRFDNLVKEIFKRPIGNIRLLPPNIPRLVRKTKTLGSSSEEAQRINSRRVPQFGQGFEGRGFIDEYRLNEIVRGSDSMLVDHVIPVAKDTSAETTLDVEDAIANEGVTTPLKNTRADGETSAALEETPVPVSKMSQQTCDSGIDSCPSSVYNPVENISAQDLNWEGNAAAPCAESDAVSLADDGFMSESAQECGGSELEEESDVIKVEKNAAESAESGVEVSEHERSGAESSGALSETAQTDQESPNTEDERECAGDGVRNIVNETDCVKEETPSKSNSPALQELDFTPTPRRNKRKMKNFKLPCKLSLLLPEKKKRTSRSSKAAELWRPSQSPCSSSSSNYPQSPMSYLAPSPSPDHHSLNIMIQEENSLIPLDSLSDSDNEGEYFDPPADGQPQVNHWIRNHQKDLLTAGQEPTLSDRVAQWQELIMPRLDTNLQHGPYSHVKYAPILMELVSRKGWPPPRPLPSPQSDQSNKEVVEMCDLEDEFIFPLDWKSKCPEMKDKAPMEESSLSMFIHYDSDFVEPSEWDKEWGEESFLGFKSVKRMKRRGVVLSPETVESKGHVRNLFSTLSRTYSWGLSEEEKRLLRREEELEKWQRDKAHWLEGRVGKGRPMRRNWDEWVEEDDNIEVNTEMDVSSIRIQCGSVGPSEPVLFTTVFSGFRKEEVSRLLFTALHLASQGHMDITSAPGEINSMKVNLFSDSRR